MDWDKLKIFHAVAEAGSFTSATVNLNLSQSAISRQIQSLEEDLKVQLFERHARGLTLTENGEGFFPIKKFKVLNSTKSNSSLDEILFKDLKLYKDDDFYLEVEFPTSSNLTIGAY